MSHKQEMLSVLKSIHEELVRANELREVLSDVENYVIAERISDLRTARLKKEVERQAMQAVVDAIKADEKGSLPFAVEPAATNIQNANVLSGKARTATTSDPPSDVTVEAPVFFDVSGPGPSLMGVRTVLVVADTVSTAQSVASKWIDNSAVSYKILTLYNKIDRDLWTKNIRNDPQTFETMAREAKSVLFVAADRDMQPENWRPAFDVITVVVSGVNGLQYQLLKGRRARE